MSEVLDAVAGLAGTIDKNHQTVLEYKSMVDDLKSQVRDLKAKGGRMSNAGSAGNPSLKEVLRESILEQKSNIQKMASGIRPENDFQFEVKAVADMTFGVNFGSANVSTATLRPGIIAAPPRPMHIRSLLSSGSMGGNHFVFVKETGHDGDPAAVLEGASKAQMDFNIAEVSIPSQVIAAYVIISEQMLYDVDGISSFLSNRLLERLMVIEDNELLSGNGTAPHQLGLNSAGNFTAATAAGGTGTIPVELLVDAIAQLAGLSRQPSGIILNPTDYHNLMINKASTSGLYNLPSVVTIDGTGISVAGIPIVWTAEQAAGTYTVGDFVNGVALMFRNAPNIRFFYDSTLAKTNKLLVRIEERVALSVFGSDYIIKGSF
jgi:HK97 family phage major capsid protein